jgi:hypothetical protein
MILIPHRRVTPLATTFLTVVVATSVLLQSTNASYVISIMPSTKECFQFHTPRGVSSLSSIS